MTEDREPTWGPELSIGDPGTSGAVEGIPAATLNQQADSVCDGGIVDGTLLRVASVRGSAHRYANTPKQDDYCIGVAGTPDQGGPWLVIAVADGVSAGAQSHVAARLAVRLAVPKLAAALDADLPIEWDRLIGELAGSILQQARRDTGDAELSQADAAHLMASTVVLALVPTTPDDDGARRCTFVPLGDTSAWILRGGTAWEPVTPVKNEGADIAESSTPALPYLPADPVEPLTVVVGPNDAVFVMTDGVGDPLGDGTGEVGTTLASWWASPPARYRFMAQVDFSRRGYADDRTVVGLWFEGITGLAIEDAATEPAEADELTGSDAATTADTEPLIAAASEDAPNEPPAEPDLEHAPRVGFGLDPTMPTSSGQEPEPRGT